MEEENLEQEERLTAFILTQIEEKGPVPFSQFMEWCLYHPEYGYYQSGRASIGKEGDYYTSPSVHPLFGHLIGKQLDQMAEILGGGTFDVVELGGGKGYLCEDILGWAKKNRTAFYNHLKYHLLETSPFFLKEQRDRLSEYERERKVQWIEPEEFRNGKLRIEGCFLSNELVDSFPIHRVIFDQGNLKEAFVAHRDGKFEEQWGELSDQSISDYFRSMKVILEEGQKAEVNLESMRWMERVSRSLTRGFALTIDYGFLAEELYAPYRQEGTLLCYFRNQVSENPYERLGEQDITAHVNFTSLIQKGEENGLRFTGLVPQYRFLIGLGILQEMELLGREMSELDGLQLRLSLKHLIEMETGMGEVFKVLIQHKGIENPQLDGLRDLCSIPRFIS